MRETLHGVESDADRDLCDRYTKALDEIKKIRKEQAIEIKVDTEKLHALKTDRERAAKLRALIDKVTLKVEGKQTDHEELDEQIRTLADTNRTFYDQAAQYQVIVAKADTLRTQREMIDDNMHSLRSTTVELADSDKELQNQLDHHQAKLGEQKADRDDAERKMADEQDALATFERKRSSAQQKHGTLEAQRQRHKEVLELRGRLVKELSVKHDIQGFNHDLSDGEMDEFVERLEQAAVAQAKKIEDIKVTHLHSRGFRRFGADTIPVPSQAAGREAVDELQTKINAMRTAQAADVRIKKGHADSIVSDCSAAKPPGDYNG